jgi:cytochrome c553
MPFPIPPGQRRRPCSKALAALFIVLAALVALPAAAADTSAAEQLARWSAQAGAAGRAEQGRAFFSSRHGGAWSCSSCHGNPPTQAGQHASTGKDIAPLAPAFNPQAFTDSARVDKWFRRNCKDVLARECSAAEKADVLAYLTGLRP